MSPVSPLRPNRPKTVAILAGRSPAERYSIHRGYLDAVEAVGAQPVVLPAGDGTDIDRAVEFVLGCDALIVSGGNDVDPEFYGEPKGIGERDVDPGRDRFEIAVYLAAHAADLPVLGICRGIQLIAVADGAKLIPDLPHAGFSDHWDEEREYEPSHEVSADPGSMAEAALGGATLVNSIHHQAVAIPGATLRPTAWSSEGVIEAIEAPGVLGLQWHPERLVAADSRHLAPFRWVLAA